MLALAITSAVFALILLGVPIAMTLALVAAGTFVALDETRMMLVMAQRMYSSTTGFTLLAIPFFILAGNLMNTGGITHRIFAFAQALVGHMRGGLGHVNVVSSMIFSGMSGAAVADAAGLGLVEMEAMTKHGYDREFSAAITAASSTVGSIIPSSSTGSVASSPLVVASSSEAVPPPQPRATTRIPIHACRIPRW